MADLGAATATEPVSTPAATRRYPPGEGLPHARSYAAAHGHLAVFKQTHHHGFALGHWLIQQRRKARAGLLSARTLQELTLLAPGGTRPGPSPGNANTTSTAPSTPPASRSRPNSGAGPANRPPSGTNSTLTSRRY
ncbi:helicase associated domain-containing protein [Streptomyces sp. NPDC086777]|uniref:helicase associated domain-containing protein n=1 Tax=Streptomyces sp. NPDC086777 TaxID=3154866 RepID=UPI00344D6703